ncbi:uncharacterized protein LOC121688401 [Alosa sapidissima]|uniref:uncharacterized protein LOC121688401 n=1 Tax=Alosa sapidissima TaxID=34773 RepID=UPI001C089CA4|nr:uncharacterized protein LOC121688401 [Alosa sapidissima]
MPDVKAGGRTKLEEPNVESANKVQWKGSQYKKGLFLCLNQGVEDLEDLSYLQESDLLSFLRPIEARKLLSLLKKSSQQDVLDSPPSNQSNQQFSRASTSTSPVTQSDEMHLSAGKPDSLLRMNTHARSHSDQTGTSTATEEAPLGGGVGSRRKAAWSCRDGPEGTLLKMVLAPAWSRRLVLQSAGRSPVRLFCCALERNATKRKLAVSPKVLTLITRIAD